jgi:hypothetical protein
MVVMASGKVTRLHTDQVPSQGRRTQGRTLVKPAAGDRVVEVTRAYSEGTGRGSEAPAVATEEPEDSENALSVGQLDLLG